MRVLVLHDAFAEDAAPDQLDALEQARAIHDALVATGHSALIQAFQLDPAPILAFAPDLIVNLVESIGGDGRLAHLPAALFEMLSIPFTGSGSAAIALTNHKRLAKRTLAAHGVAVPEDFPLGGPRFIVKSLWEHASLGLDDSCIVDRDRVEATIARVADRMGGAVVAESYIEGRELNVSLFEEGDQLVVLPIAEIAFALPDDRAKIVGYRAKWDPESIEWQGTPRTFQVDGIDADAIAALCQRVFRIFGLRGYARVDLRVPQDAPPVVLEVNANPCLSPDAGFAAALQHSGRTFSSAVTSIVGRALR